MILATIVAAQALTQVTPQIVVMGKATAAAHDLFAIIDRQSTVDSFSTHGTRIENLSGDIRLQSVNFSYPSRPDVQVLKNFSHDIPPN